MFKEILFLFLIGHLLGDFYFQSERTANLKKDSIKYLLKHSLIYLLSLLIVFIPILNTTLFIRILIVGIIHFIIDYYKCFIHETFFLKTSKIKLFCLDQLAHIITIFIVTLWIDFANVSIQYLNVFQTVNNRYSIDVLLVLSWIFIILLILKPTSIMIKIALENYQPELDENDKGVPNAGALIGKLERIFILMMLFVGQYAAIGFILTAKSIARYEKIVKNPKFSEYYLLGTLLSTLSVILYFHLIF